MIVSSLLGWQQHQPATSPCSFLKSLQQSTRCLHMLAFRSLNMSTSNQNSADKEGAAIHFRVDKKLRDAFNQVVAEQDRSKSQLIRDFMRQTIRAAGREDLLKN